MAPTYRVHYFNDTALGEGPRYILAYGKADWEDVRYERGAEWEKVKSKILFKKLPVLEIDGKPYAQSVAINRYLGNKFGLGGKDELENLQIDMSACLCLEFLDKISSWAYDPVPVSKASKEEPLYKEHIPYYLSKFEDMVKANGGYIVGGKLTWADIFFVAPLNYYMWQLGKNILPGYPGLQALVKKVESEPAIANYIAKRPKNPDNK